MGSPETQLDTATWQARWPARLQELGVLLSGNPSERERARLRGEAWLILNPTLNRLMLVQGKRFRDIPEEDLADIASERSLSLLHGLESGKWRPQERKQLQIRAYLTRVAVNSLINHVARARRHVSVDSHERPESLFHSVSSSPGQFGGEPTDARAQRRNFANALNDCLEGISFRARRIWFLRTFLELPSKTVARLPDIDTTHTNVNVIYMRSRDAIAECMTQKGFDRQDAPPGTFAMLWCKLRTRPEATDYDERAE